MSIISILYACISSVILYFVFSESKDLSKQYEWALNVAVPCLIATTLILNFIKDKISERDSTSKLYKANQEIAKIKEESAIEKARLNDEIEKLNNKISVKDTIIMGIRNGLTTNLIQHGDTPKFMAYVKNLTVTISSDIEVNTLAPATTPESRKYMEIFSN